MPKSLNGSENCKRAVGERAPNGESPSAQHDSTSPKLPSLRWVPADSLASLRRVHRVLSRHEGISVERVQSQLVWRCLGTSIARVWLPHPHDAQAGTLQFELTVFLARHARSPRWSDVVPLQPDRVAHHLPVHCRDDIDFQVLQWLQEAWDCAWRRPRAPGRSQHGAAANALRWAPV
jgi:hypothetical protein